MSIKVYKASAGAGKTYTLVYEYIRYLFSAQESSPKLGEVAKPEGYVNSKLSTLNLHRGILAVTFTNKATAEMKERIVKGLYDLSRGEKEDYVEKLRKDVPAVKKMSDQEIRLRAKALLTDILQDYTQFRVSTIDGFFQQVVRSFARELNLNNQYQVELDTGRILELAVDNMLASLDAENAHLLEWLTEFASDRVEDDKSWNPRGAMLELAKLITTEEYTINNTQLSNGNAAPLDFKRLKEYRDNLRDIVRRFEKDLKEACDAAQVVLNGVPNVDDVLIKNQISYFKYDYLKGKGYEVTNTFMKGAVSDDVAVWCKGMYKKDADMQPVVSQLHDCAKRIVDMCVGERKREYQTARLVMANLYIIGILNEIDRGVADICREKDCLLLSSTSDFINKIIDNSDTPFIYEKVGVRTDHFMIDEFQDTSRLQWSNFVPLLREAVAQGNDSMIVGDVKQSIYRWRNGDWRILHEGVKSEFGDYVVDVPLEHNYRSTEEVIEFNNLLYSQLPKLLDEAVNEENAPKVLNLESVYAGSSQKFGGKNKAKGYVRVEFFTDDDEDKDLTWKEQSMNCMVNTMRVRGDYGKMAVLVRTNKEAQLVAAKLTSEAVPFFSSEALCVADNVAVRFIVAVLEYFMQPHEQLYRANVVALHREACGGRLVSEEDFVLMSYRDRDYAEWEMCLLGDEEQLANFRRMRHLPLIQMIEGLIDIFALNRGEHSIYLQSFLDKVHNYAIDGTLDIRSLLEFWSQQGNKTFVAMPEGGEAVRILTIHKAKGLEFDMVFVPFIDWEFGLSGKDDIRLATTKDKTRKNHLFIDEVPLIPINLKSSSKLQNSDFCEEVKREYLAMCMDVMNVLYVATTRASRELYLHCAEPKEKNKKDDNKLENISVAEMLRKVLFEAGSDKVVYESGELEQLQLPSDKSNPSNPSDKSDCPNSPNSPNSPTSPTTPTSLLADRFALRYTYSEDADDARQYGILMHRLFEQIKTFDDVDEAIASLERNGEDVSSMRQEVEAIFAIDGVAELFDPKWQVLNEAEIFDGKGKAYRPDRVMIDHTTHEVVVVDYKFGEYTTELHERYQRQVARYVHLIREMGYNARGYILYASNRQLFNLK